MATRNTRMYLDEKISVIQNSQEINEITVALQCIRSGALTLGDYRQKVVAEIESELFDLRRISPRDGSQQRLFDRLENALVETLSEVQRD